MDVIDPSAAQQRTVRYALHCTALRCPHTQTPMAHTACLCRPFISRPSPTLGTTLTRHTCGTRSSFRLAPLRSTPSPLHEHINAMAGHTVRSVCRARTTHAHWNHTVLMLRANGSTALVWISLVISCHLALVVGMCE
jgi:hypothetical protein